MRSRSARYATCTVSHLNSAATVDSPAGRVVTEPLDAEAPAPFGDFIDASGVPTPLGSSGLFAVVDRVGPDENCEVRRLAQPFAVVERR